MEICRHLQAGNVGKVFTSLVIGWGMHVMKIKISTPTIRNQFQYTYLFHTCNGYTIIKILLGTLLAELIVDLACAEEQAFDSTWVFSCMSLFRNNSAEPSARQHVVKG